MCPPLIFIHVDCDSMYQAVYGTDDSTSQRNGINERL